jgi:uncharacterized protein (TIGR03067 family)
MKTLLMALMLMTMALVSGCVTAPPPDLTAIQGTWKGQEVRNGQAVGSWLTFVGRELEFRPVDGRNWFKGTFSLRQNTDPKQLVIVITESSEVRNDGKTALALYELKQASEEQGTLVISLNEPGNPQAPEGFRDRRARQIVFTRQ